MPEAHPADNRSDEPAPIVEIKRLFLAARGMGLAERESYLHRECGGDTALRKAVLKLIEGDRAPLPFESLADDIRAARDGLSDAPTETFSRRANTKHHPGEHTGDVIGRYRLLERIGEGGFGAVYLAQQHEPVKRRVALKIIKLGMDTRQVVARFEAERQALAIMDHPCIAKVFDAGATDTGRPYFVMELVKGVPITQFCDEQKLPIRARLELVAHVCDALQHAHQKGVIHRDIKPANILVSLRDAGPEVKIIDFGIAKATSARLTEKTVYTEFRQMVGTPEYMSPEQAGESGEDVDTRTDVYSVGVLLYELLVGATPFDSKRLRSAAFGEMQRIIREEDPPKPSTRLTKHPESLGAVAKARATPPAKLPSTIRGELDWIVMKAMEKDRRRRYDSAGAMAADIQRFLAGHAVQAAPPDTWYRARKFVRRNKTPVIAGSLLTLALVAGLIGTSVGFFRAERQRRVAETEKTRANTERERADLKAEQALAAEARASRSAYSANILSAWSAAATNQFTAARAFLDAAPQSLRGWEWRTLSSRLDTSVRAIPCPMPDWKPGEVQWANDLIPHPDGRSFFTVRRFGIDAAQRWDIATGTLIARYARPLGTSPDMYTASYFSISPDGSRLWGYSGTVMNVPACAVSAWDLATNARVFHAELPPAGDADGVVAMTPDGSRVIRNRDQKMWVQDVHTGAVLAEGRGYGMGGFKTVSTDGTLLAATDKRGSIEIYDTRTLDRVALLDGHTNIVFGLDFSRDSRWLASAAIDGRAFVWDLHATPPTSVLLEHTCAVESVRLSPDASLAATMGRDLTIRVWDSHTGELKGTYTSGELVAGTVMFMPDGKTVAGRERDGTVRFWDVTAETTVNLSGHKGILNAAYFAPAAGLIVSAGWDGWKGSPGCVRLWDAETGEETASIGVPGEVAYYLAVSPDGTRAAASITKTDSPWTPKELTRHNRIEIIDLLTGHTTKIENGRPETDLYEIVTGLSFDPRSALLAVGREGRLEIRDARDGSVLRARETGFDRKWIRYASWSPDGRTIACAPKPPDGASIGDPGGVEILDAGTLEAIRRLDCGPVASIAYSPDGAQLCVGSPDGLVRFFTAATGELVRTLAAHEQGVDAIAFNPDGTRLATVSGNDGDITVWNTATWDRVARHHEDDHVASVAWSPDGSRLLGTCGKTPRLWDDTPLSARVQAREARRAAADAHANR